MSQRLSRQTIDELSPFVPREALLRTRVLTAAPWRWFPLTIRMGAVTFGDHVMFRSGRYDPATPPGLSLIAHEVMHVAQYRRYGRVGMMARYLRGQFKCRFRHDDHPMERECIVVQRRVRGALERERMVARGEAEAGAPGAGC
jgi:hypothetical protein